MKSACRTTSLAALLALALVASCLAAASAAAAKTPAWKRVVPVWAGVKHGKPVAGAFVIVRSPQGKRLAPRVRTGRSGAASVIAPRRLPPSFVIEVRTKGHGRSRPVLRATVRNWKRPRVVYVDPFSTLVNEYGKLHPKMSTRTATVRVQRHLGIGPDVVAPDASTFWAEKSFSGRRFAGAAKGEGMVGLADSIARETDGATHRHRFLLPAQGRKGKKGGKQGDGTGAPTTAGSEESKLASELNAQRLQMQRELMAAAQAGMAIVSGNPSALLQIGKLLDALLGGGDTAELKQIATQLATVQTGVSQIEQQVAALDSEVSLAAYSSAVQAYRPTQQAIDLAWEEYMHAATSASEGDQAAAKAEAQALVAELKSWGNPITSSAAVPYDENAPGLMAWAQNASAKGQNGGVMTAATQAISRAAGFKWWNYWAKDLILHTEKWGDPETAGAITQANAKRLGKEAEEGLQKAEKGAYGKDLGGSVIYAISAGKLYSVGTVWNLKPTVLPPSAGQPDWSGMTTAEAESLPSAAVGLSHAMMTSVPALAENPNTSMTGVLGPQANNGTAPSFAGTGGGYGLPPGGTHLFALRSPTGGSECSGQWNWSINGQGSSSTTGAPIIEICPAYDAEKRKVVGPVCSQVLSPGQFFGWSEDFPSIYWAGIWRREKAIQFTTCNDLDFWNTAEAEYKGLNWGTGVFAGSSPLTNALHISESPSAYFGLWTRPVGPEDNFLVGPFTNSG